MRDADHPFQKLCLEAVSACGDDIPAIEQYVKARLAVMPDGEQLEVRRDIERVLAFREPLARLQRTH